AVLDLVVVAREPVGEHLTVRGLRPLEDVDQLAAQLVPQAHGRVSVRGGDAPRIVLARGPFGNGRAPLPRLFAAPDASFSRGPSPAVRPRPRATPQDVRRGRMGAKTGGTPEHVTGAERGGSMKGRDERTAELRALSTAELLKLVRTGKEGESEEELSIILDVVRERRLELEALDVEAYSRLDRKRRQAAGGQPDVRDEELGPTALYE